MKTRNKTKEMDYIIRPHKLAEKLGISTVTLWRMEKAGELPRRVKIGPRIVGWRESEINDWLDKRPLSEAYD